MSRISRPFSLTRPFWPRSADEDPFAVLQREVERIFDEVGRGVRLPARGEGSWVSRVDLDVTETAEGLEVKADLPGLTEKDVTVTLHEDLLTIEGQRSEEREQDDKQYHLRERSYGSFARSLRLPFVADPAKVEAQFDRGVLMVKVARPAQAEPAARKIEIKPLG